MRRFFILIPLMLCAACVHESAIPLGNDRMEINVSAAAIYGRAGAKRIAMENAAKATLQAGYDKFVVLGSDGWNESSFVATNYGQASVSGFNGQASSGGFATTARHPEARMVIRMFHRGDKSAASAVDAKALLKANENSDWQ